MRTGSILVASALLCVASPLLRANETPEIPEGGVPVLTASNKWILCTQSNGARLVTYQRASVSAGPIVQCRIAELATGQLWRTSCDMRFTNGFARGDVVVVTGRARTLETVDPDGRGIFRCLFRLNEKPYDKQFKVEFHAGKDWSRFYFPAVLDFDIPAPKGVVIFNLGYAVQMVELCDVQIYRFPPGFDLKRLPKTEFTPSPR